MTITSTTNRVSYAGDGSTTAFPFPHRFLADADLLVILVASDGTETTQTLSTDYTVSGAGSASGGTVTMTTAPASGKNLVIINDPDIKQPYDPEDGSALAADSLETAVDRLTLIAQRIASRIGRSFRLSDGDTSGADTDLPAPSALKFIRWNSDATAFENVGAANLGDAVIGTGGGDVPNNDQLANSPGLFADTYAALKGLSTSSLTDGETRYVRGKGQVQWFADDRSTEVSADTNEVLWFPPDLQTDGSNGAWKKVSGFIDAEITVTVGSGGMYSTINSAIADLQNLAPQYDVNQHTVTINLLTGFTMAEQVIANSVDLSWMRITSDDAEVTITRSALTTQNENDDYPAFAAQLGGQLIRIDALFNMDSSGTATARHGVRISKNSQGVIESGAGVKNAGDRGLYVTGSSTAFALNTVWDGASGHCIRASNSSVINVRNASAKNGGTAGLTVAGASQANAQGMDASGSSGDGVRVGNSSNARLDGVNTDNAVGTGFIIGDGSIASLGKDDTSTSASADSCADGVEISDGSIAMCDSIIATGATSDGVTVRRGAVASFEDADCSGAGSRGAVVIASYATFENANTQKGGSPSTDDLVVFTGSTVNARNMTGGTSQNLNTMTGEGIIFDSGSSVESAVSDGTTGGSGSAGSGNQYVELTISGTTYKVLHDGTA